MDSILHGLWKGRGGRSAYIGDMTILAIQKRYNGNELKIGAVGEETLLKPSNKLRAYLLRARDWGIDPRRILEGSGVEWDEVISADSFDPEFGDLLFDHVARYTPPDFAIRCGHTTKVRDFGVVGLAMESMPTLRDAFRLWNRYSLVAGQPFITSIVEAGDQWRMHFVPRRLMAQEGQRFCLEASITALEVVIEQLTGTRANSVAIDLPFDRPASIGHYETLRTRNVRFGCETASYCGLRADLDRLIPDSDREISEALMQECEQFLADLTRGRTISQQLDDIIRSTKGRMPSLEEMAASLSVSGRSLQRELSREGLTYQELVRRFRERHAMELLKGFRPNIKEIAFTLGFRDVGSFRRAFLQWTGRSIGDWQKLVLSV
jgi:AraC-like DNA-binding protein